MPKQVFLTGLGNLLLCAVIGLLWVFVPFSGESHCNILHTNGHFSTHCGKKIADFHK